tara:strand:+ start:130 stop:723 length:594 start_codon:yes stop_codon:yes gene_type:complete
MADSKYSESIKFYKPKIRFIIPIKNFIYPKKLFNEFKKTQYMFKVNHNFPRVIELCKEVKRKENETWINNIILNTFIELHKVGKSHSVECYENDKLIGGLYGLHLGSCFFGESMFSLKKNTSKFCLLYLLAILKKHNFSVLDSQFFNPHLLQFGAYEIENESYEKKLKESLKKESLFQNIDNLHEALSLIQSNNQRS